MGESIKVPTFRIILDGVKVFHTAKPKELPGAVFGILIGSGSHHLEAGRLVVTMGLCAIKDGVSWTFTTKSGQKLKVLPPNEGEEKDCG